MSMEKIINQLDIAMKRRTSRLPERLRLFTADTQTLPRALSLTGARGVGKTTFLLNHAQNRTMLHLSMDNPLLSGTSLYELASSIFMAGYEGVVVDEVHFAKDWSLHLKALYDDFPDHTIWTSDSSSLVLRNGVADLSRRFVNMEMPLLSFREFLHLETGIKYPPYDPFIGSDPSLPEADASLLMAFQKYKKCGTRPFCTEDNFDERMLAVLDKTLYYDVPFFLPNVTDGNLRLMKAISATLAESPIPRLSVNSLCTDWSIGSDKLYQLLEVMEAVGFLRLIRTENDKKARSAGKKLFFADPVYYSVLGGSIGNMREAMVSMCCENAGWKVEACKDEPSGDFVISRRKNNANEQYKIEVGGASKNIKKADFVIRDDTDIRTQNAIPLWMIAMMY